MGTTVSNIKETHLTQTDHRIHVDFSLYDADQIMNDLHQLLWEAGKLMHKDTTLLSAFMSSIGESLVNVKDSARYDDSAKKACARFMQLKDWHKLSINDRDLVKLLVDESFLYPTKNGFVGSTVS